MRMSFSLLYKKTVLYVQLRQQTQVRLDDAMNKRAKAKNLFIRRFVYWALEFIS